MKTITQYITINGLLLALCFGAKWLLTYLKSQVLDQWKPSPTIPNYLKNGAN